MSLAKPALILNAPTGQAVRFVLKGARLPRASTTLLTSAFRAAALSALHAHTGSRESLLLSGHRADGSPAQGHNHAYYLPQFEGDDQPHGLLVVSPNSRFFAEDLSALESVRMIRWAGPSTRTSIELADADDRSCFQVATKWISVTPYAPLRRFWGTSGKRHLTPDRQLASELASRVPEAKGVEMHILSETRALLRLPSNNISARPAWQRAFEMELELPTPICGPIALGHSSHFGLGLFVPAD